MERIYKGVRRLAVVILGLAGAALAKKLVDLVFEVDPASAYGRVTAWLLVVYEHPLFLPVAGTSVGFAVGVWVDYLLRKATKRTEGEKRERLLNLAHQADLVVSDMDRLQRKLLSGRVDPALFAEITSLMTELRGEGFAVPRIAADDPANIGRLVGYLKALSVYLKRGQIEMARSAHEHFNFSEPVEPEPSDRI